MGGFRSQWLLADTSASRSRTVSRPARSLASEVKGRLSLSPPSTPKDDAPKTSSKKGESALSLPDVPEMPDAERLAEEKKALGFYMSSRTH